MASDLLALLRRRRIHVFVDLKVLTRALRARTPVAVARRQAEYILLDNQRVPLGFDDSRFLDATLARVQAVRNGMAYTRGGVVRPKPAAPLPQPLHLPPSPGRAPAGVGASEARLALRRQAHTEA
jgi:hypothetical protein